jgi:hypothetical protein
VRKVLFVFVLLASTCLGLQTAPAQPARGMEKVTIEGTKTMAALNAWTHPQPFASSFKEVTKEKFKEYYFRYGVNVANSGWTVEYWEQSFEKDAKPGWKYMLEEPKSASHNRMNIVEDNKAKEYRMFFLTEDDDTD